MSDTLVLDLTYTPIKSISWKKAIVKVLIDHTAEVVEEYPDRYINTPNWTINMPSVIKLMKVVPRKRGVKFSRANVYERDHGKCQYCATHISPRVATFDHVLPRSQGGLTSWENVVIACNDCNQKKGGRTPEQARMKLLSKPGRPKKLSGTAIDIEYRPGMPEAWKNYMRSTLYWNIELENSNKKED